MIITLAEFYNKETEQWQNINYVYPIKFTERVDKELDSGEFNFYSPTVKFAPYRMCRITVSDDNNDSSEKQFYFYANDSTQWIPAPVSQFRHRFLLVEPTKELEGMRIDGLAVVQPIESNATQLTLLNTLTRLLQVTPLRIRGQAQKYFITSDEAVVQKLTAKISPQFNWGSQTTLWECLLDIGACIDAIPRLTVNSQANKYNVITFDLINEQKRIVNNLNYNGLSVQMDESQYCTAIESIAENLVTGDKNEGSVTFPSPNAFISPRTSNDVRLTEQNCQIVLPNKASEILHLWIDGNDVQVLYLDEEDNSENIFTAAQVGLDKVDIIKFLVDTAKWETLEFVHPSPDKVASNLRKNNTITWNKFGNTINLLNTVYHGVIGLFNQSVLQALMQSLLVYHYEQFPQKVNIDGKTYSYKKLVPLDLGGITKQYATPTQLHWRVEYIPLNPAGKIRSVKDVPSDFDFIQSFNQRAEINNAAAFGKSMKSTVTRLGVDTLTIVLLKSTWEDAMHVGDVFNYENENYIITSASFEIVSPIKMLCVYSLSAEWNYLSKYVEIDKQFRSWNIPSEILQRDLYYCDYLEAAETAEANNSSIELKGFETFAEVLKSTSSTYTEVNNAWVRRSNNLGAVLSTTSFSFGNSIVFNAKTQDNLSAGKRRNADDLQYCQDTYYCEEDGTLSTCNLIFSGKILQINENALPYAKFASTTANRTNWYNTNNYIVGLQNLQVQKSPSEQLNFIYQLHVVTQLKDLILGEALTAQNPLVKQFVGNKSFQLWGITKKLPKQTNQMTDYFGVKIKDTNGTSDWSITVENGSIKFSLNPIQGNYIGWAITDVNGIIYLAENKPALTQRTLYLNAKHYYKS